MNGPMIDGGGTLLYPAKVQTGRRVAGAVLALVGTAIATQLLRAIVTNRASTHAAWSAYVPVLLVFGTVALAFLLPGALMLFYRRDVRVDLASRQVVERQTYLGLGRTRSYPLSSFAKTVLARRFTRRRQSWSSVGSSHARRSYPCFVVELAPARGTALRIMAAEKEEPVREAAVKLAALTRLVLDDQVERERARGAAGLGEEDEA